MPGITNYWDNSETREEEEVFDMMMRARREREQEAHEMARRESPKIAEREALERALKRLGNIRSPHEGFSRCKEYRNGFWDACNSVKERVSDALLAVSEGREVAPCICPREQELHEMARRENPEIAEFDALEGVLDVTRKLTAPEGAFRRCDEYISGFCDGLREAKGRVLSAMPRGYRTSHEIDLGSHDELWAQQNREIGGTTDADGVSILGEIRGALSKARGALEVYAGSDQHSLDALNHVDRALACIGASGDADNSAF